MDSSIYGNDNDNSGEIYYFDLITILAATNNFSDANKLGEGGFGPVYKVKRLFIFGIYMFGNYLIISFELSVNLSVVTYSKVFLPILRDKFPHIKDV